MKSNNIEDIYPLSPMQRGMLFHTLLAPESGVYFNQLSGTLRGDLNIPAFNQAWQRVVDRHSIVRTAFVWKGLEEPLQVVRRQVTLSCERQDWRGLSYAAQQQQLDDLLAADQRRGFTLSVAPLMRLALIQLSGDAYQFVWSHHHLLMDAWSLPILLREVFMFYEAFCRGEDIHLKRPQPYRHYIAWLQRQDPAKSKAFWQETLRGLAAPTSLSVGRTPAGVPASTQDYDERQIRLSPGSTSALQSLSRKHQLTLNTLVQGAWALLLSHYSGEQDVVFGATASSRPSQLPDVESMVGLFINTLPVRVRVSPEVRLLPWLIQIQEQQMEARQYVYSSLVEIQGWSAMPRGLPLFESIVVFENSPSDELSNSQNSSMSIENIRCSEKTNYPLTLVVGPGSELALKLMYDTRRFDDATISRMLDHLRTLLEQMPRRPEQRVEELRTVTGPERQQVLVEWNQTTADYPQDRCIHELFEAQVKRTPEAVAVVFGNEQLTYRELNQRAEQLAEQLAGLGVGPEVLVGISLERSLEMVVSILGILKAGGAYVPLDPSYPKERLAYMLEDSQLSVLVTQERLLAQLPEHRAHVILVDEAGSFSQLFSDGEGGQTKTLLPHSRCEAAKDSARLEEPTVNSHARQGVVCGYPDENKGPKDRHKTCVAPSALPFSTYAGFPASRPGLFPAGPSGLARADDQTSTFKVRPDNLAYMIYTSGSTGKPKGVQIRHRAVVNFLHSMRHEPGLTDNDVLLAVTVLSFDIAALELFLPLTVGARLVIATGEAAADGARLSEMLIESGATVMQATPITWRLLLGANWQGNPGLKALCGGEALSPELSRELVERCASLWNLYGPTETTIWSTVHRVDDDAGAVPIGRPLANTEIYLLDAELQPVPVGVTGELYIGGAGLARGYLHRPELTAEKFIPHPFSLDPGARLYRTGDLARYLPDGVIDCLGRIDHQVKIRGFRIELGEIEARLEQHEAIRQAVVLAREDSPGDKRLVAYVGGTQTGLSVEELRRHAGAVLPEYMVPSAFVMLPELPLTPNGKVDRRALPAPDRERPELEKTYVAPRTLVEELVAGIWSQVLGIEQVGIHDNFFDLGGHSLAATQLISSITHVFSVNLPIRTIFESPTVAEVAESIEAFRRVEQIKPVSPIRPVPRNTPLPASFAQQRMWLHDHQESDRTIYNAPLALRLKGVLNARALEQSLNELLRRHESLRTTFDTVICERGFSSPRAGELVQIIHPYEPVQLPVIDLAGFPYDEREPRAMQIAAQEARRLFDLERGPLFYIKLLRLGEHDHVLLLMMHHIVTDAWSLGIFLRELAVLYEAFSAGQVCPLPELPIQYADFAVWQHGWLKGEELEQQLSYWKNQFGGRLPVLSLRTDFPRSSSPVAQGESQAFVLSEPLTSALKALSRREGVTLFMMLLAAYKTLLYLYTGQEDIIVGSPIANRNRPETEQLIGFFANVLALRTNLSGNPTYRELLSRIREVTLGAYAHQDVSFENVMDSLRQGSKASRAPLFQVWFALEKTAEAPKLSGVDVDLLYLNSGLQKLDLTLRLWEGPEGLSGQLEYRKDLFDSTTIAQMAEDFRTLLENIVADPGQHLSELALMAEVENRA